MKKSVSNIIAIAALAGSMAVLMPHASAVAAGDAAKGKKVFNKCRACHVADKEQNKVGPHLVGVVGRKAASVASFTKYSKPMKASGLTWDEATLDAYLENPKKIVPKGTMAFAGLKKKEDRDDVIAYLKSVAK